MNKCLKLEYVYDPNDNKYKIKLTKGNNGKVVYDDDIRRPNLNVKMNNEEVLDSYTFNDANVTTDTFKNKLSQVLSSNDNEIKNIIASNPKIIDNLCCAASYKEPFSINVFTSNNDKKDVLAVRTYGDADGYYSTYVEGSAPACEMPKLQSKGPVDYKKITNFLETDDMKLIGNRKNYFSYTDARKNSDFSK